MRSCTWFYVILCCSNCMVEYTLFLIWCCMFVRRTPHPSLFLMSIKFIFIFDKKKKKKKKLQFGDVLQSHFPEKMQSSSSNINYRSRTRMRFSNTMKKKERKKKLATLPKYFVVANLITPYL